MSSSSSSMYTNAAAEDGTGKHKPRILCLHGKYQSGATFSNKIAGARRKLQRVYELEFLDGPIRLNSSSDDDEEQPDEDPAFAWWHKDDQGRHSLVQEGMDYVLHHMQAQSVPYQAILGFSQGGVMATAVACTGKIPSLRAVVTAGSPMVTEAFEMAQQFLKEANNADDNHDSIIPTLVVVPKLHLAGETDAMIPIESTRQLCDQGGNGQLIVHDQGHLFPTRAARVQEVLDFLEQHVLQC